jgi:hypothetical protein
MLSARSFMIERRRPRTHELPRTSRRFDAGTMLADKSADTASRLFPPQSRGAVSIDVPGEGLKLA